MRKSIEDVVVRTKRSTRKPWQSRIILGVFAVIGFWAWHVPGALVGLVLAVLCNMAINSVRGLRVWNLCERDYAQLISEGYSENQALLIISRSFSPQLSNYFHEQVINKFSSLNEVVVFFTGALPENVEDEEWALKCIEKTTIEKNLGGRAYKARTKWRS